MGTGFQPNSLLPIARSVLKDLIKIKGPDYKPVKLMDLGEKILNIQFGQDKNQTAASHSGEGTSNTRSKSGFFNQQKQVESPSQRNHAATTSAENQKMAEALARLSYLTSDPEKLKAFLADPHDGFIYSLEGFLVVVDVLQYIQNPKNIKKMPESVPILMVSGQEDPVGHDGKDVITLAKQYEKMGIPVQVHIYEGMRHQILDERDPLPVYRDITKWILNLPAVQEYENKISR